MGEGEGGSLALQFRGRWGPRGARRGRVVQAGAGGEVGGAGPWLQACTAPVLGLYPSHGYSATRGVRAPGGDVPPPPQAPASPLGQEALRWWCLGDRLPQAGLESAGCQLCSETCCFKCGRDAARSRAPTEAHREGWLLILEPHAVADTHRALRSLHGSSRLPGPGWPPLAHEQPSSVSVCGPVSRS